MTERPAYRVYVNYKGEQKLEEARCIITPKRVSVSSKHGSGWSSASYYEPQNWPQGGYAWTVQEAWETFLAEKRKELETFRSSIEWAEQHIAAAEASLKEVTA